MFTSQLQHTLTKGSLYEKSLDNHPRLKMNSENQRSSSLVHDDSAQLFKDKIMQHLHPSEQSMLMRYFGRREESSQKTPNGVRSYSSALESLEDDATFQKLKKNKTKNFFSEISKTSTDRLKTKRIGGEKSLCGDSLEVRQKELSSAREKVSVPLARGDYAVRKDLKFNHSFRNYASLYHSEKTCIEDKIDLLTSKFNSISNRLNAAKRLTMKPDQEVHKTHTDREREQGPRNKICLPRLVHSDLSDRRAKASLGAESSAVVTRPAPPPRPDVPRRRFSQLATASAPAPAPGATAAVGASPLAATPATLYHRLRESVSDAKVSAGTGSGSRRGTRSRKAPAQPRTPKVRAARPLSHFLRAGFHPPEPGTAAPRAPRPPRRHGARPGPGADADDADPDADADAPDGDWDEEVGGGGVEEVGASPAYEPFPDDLGGFALPERDAPPPGAAAGDVRFPDAVPRVARDKLRALSRREHLLRATVPALALAAHAGPPPLGLRPRSAAPGPGELLGRSSAPRPISVPKKAADPSSLAQPVTYPPIPSFLLGGRNRRGRPGSRGTNKYRSVPVLKGNLFLTMPSIQEESESLCSQDVHTEDEIEEDLELCVEDEIKKIDVHPTGLERSLREVNKSDKNYWLMLQNMMGDSAGEKDEKPAQKKEEHNKTVENAKTQIEKEDEKSQKSEKRSTKGDHKKKHEKKDRNAAEENRNKPENKQERQLKAEREALEEEAIQNEIDRITDEARSTATDSITDDEKGPTEEPEPKRQAERAKPTRAKEATKKAPKSRETSREDPQAKGRAAATPDERRRRKPKDAKGGAAREERPGAGRHRKGKAEEGGGGGEGRAKTSAAASLKKLRRGLRRDSKAAAECQAAERVMARWMQCNEAMRLREMTQGRGEGSSGRRRRPGSRKHSATSHSAAESSEKKEKRPSALSEQWQSAKSAVRRGEMQLLARAEKLV